ncbi:DeoR/GlpR family DNA-binding transcription regulator [Salinivibrio sp. IB643]|jgi:Transcriptional regulators of sugar metabolism|uniref:DeoR/GlpR family DNA-binding transcription regulator n=1 Tax=Salinivibrio TaxID=51366 RepID=UPI000988D285|nr:DeoR/GlpR family DNA-binding transcription regulator [Salinivibrio sp. IB643]OOE96898.1 DeoR family transcriptional regulator [Salinivibrio sp. IB643]
MIPAERRRTIISLLSAHEVISINELADRLQVSHMTIRRDIAKLEDVENVTSVSGGVQLTQILDNEPSHDVKSVLNSNEKSAIGYIASQLIPKKSTIYLDAGTTTLEIARHIAQRDDLLVITNDFVIAAYLSRHSECELYHTGGRVDKANQSTVGGKVAEFLTSMNIDIAFISTSSWNIKEISTPSEPKVAVKKAVATASQRNILVSDSSKYGRVATFHAIGIKYFDTIVTDTGFPLHVQNELEEKGIKVLTAHLDEPLATLDNKVVKPK